MEQGVNISFFPIGQIGTFPEAFAESVCVAIENAKDYEPTASCVRICHQNQMDEWVGTGKRYALAFFELDQFQGEEIASMNNADEFLAPSHWAKSILEKTPILKDKKTSVVPMGVDMSIFNDGYIPSRLDSFTNFINIGKIEIRKGHDFLLEAFNKAFEPSDKVKLSMVCYNPFIGDGNIAWERSFKQSKMGRSIKFHPRLTGQGDLTRLMRQADCGVFPARAEGWNLDLLECMATGLPVIATNYSGQTE